MNTFVPRLLDFYKRFAACQTDTMSGIWMGRLIKNQAALLHALDSQDIDVTSRLLAGMAIEGEMGTLGGTYFPAWPKDILTGIARLTDLAVRVGCLPAWNPEQPFDYPPITPELLLANIEERLGVTITFPIEGISGLRLNGRIIPYNLINYASLLYTAVGNLGHIPQKVLEIGPGLGFMGYLIYSKYLTATSYTTIDLPVGCVIHGYLLGVLCGPENIWLKGEPEGLQPIKIYPSTSFSELKNTHVEAVFNQDSIPEIPQAIVQSYLKLIEKVLLPHGAFISFNQESGLHGQISVQNAVRHNGGLRTTSRSFAITRPGYVEEVFTRSKL